MSTIASLVRIPVADIVHHIDEVLESNPERTKTGHLKRWHFEYERKLVTYGEDRSRSWIWPVAPLWSRYLYEFVLTQVPERYGHGPSGLCFPLLELMNPALAEAPVFSSMIVPRPSAPHIRQYMLDALIDSTRFLGSYIPGSLRVLEAARRLTMRPTEAGGRTWSASLCDLLQQPSPLWEVIDPHRLEADLPALSMGHSRRFLTLALYSHHLSGLSTGSPKCLGLCQHTSK
jgi:hypothetical protein